MKTVRFKPLKNQMKSDSTNRPPSRPPRTRRNRIRQTSQRILFAGAEGDGACKSALGFCLESFATVPVESFASVPVDFPHPLDVSLVETSVRARR